MNRVLARLNALSIELAERSVGATAPIALNGIPAEVAPLARSMNSLIVRLHDAVEAQRRFISDAAHELRTPLAGMQIQVDNFAREAQAPIAKRRRRLRAGFGVRARSSISCSIWPDLKQSGTALDEMVDVNALVLECRRGSRGAGRRKGIDLEVNFACQAFAAAPPTKCASCFRASSTMRCDTRRRADDRCVHRARRRPLRRRSVQHGSAPSQGRRDARIRSVLSRRSPGDGRDGPGTVDRAPGRRTACFRPHR